MGNTQTVIRRPQLKNIDAAIKAWYGTGYINNSTIAKIFGVRSDATVARLKKAVRAEEVERGIPTVVPFHVNVKVAFEVWNIDINELVKNREKLIKLGMQP